VPELPVVTGAEAVRAFEKLGFVLDRVSGSHHVLRKPGHVYHLSIPVHARRTLGRGLLKAVLKAGGVSVEEFRAVL